MKQQQYYQALESTLESMKGEFQVEGDELFFNGVPLMDILRKYGAPLKLTYLPRIRDNIRYAQDLFDDARRQLDYVGQYIYCYCTKASHFSFVIEEALGVDNVHLELSSAFDVPIARSLYRKGRIAEETYVLCNGFKPASYLEGIAELLHDGFRNCIPILDDKAEFEYYERHVHVPYCVGLRIAVNEVSKSGEGVSRFGIPYADIMPFYKGTISKSKYASLKMLHLFVSSGIRDTRSFWGEFESFLSTYCTLKKVCPTLDSIDIGGGFPIRNSTFDHRFVVTKMLQMVQQICGLNDTQVPDIFSEFGMYTVGESGAVLYKIDKQKLQAQNQLWYIINGSFITQVPDSWALNEKFLLLALNKWKSPTEKVNIGGQTCDKMDCYNNTSTVLPRLDADEPLFVGLFHTGAYQEALAGYGGIQHCLIPAPKHVLIDADEDGTITTTLFAAEQSPESMLNILGY